MSTEACVRTGRGPVSSAKPNLPGSFGISGQRHREGPGQSGGLGVVEGRDDEVAEGLGLDVRVDQALSAKVVDEARVGGLGHAAQLQVGAGGEVDDAVAVGLGGFRDGFACVGLRRPSGGRMRTTRPSPDCIGRSAPGHQPLISQAVMRCGLGLGRLMN
jgi:hypothetical protein